MNSRPQLAPRDSSLKVYVWWATSVAWAATITKLSSKTYAGWFTAWLLQHMLDLFRISVSPPTFDLLHHLTRKLAHLTEYAIFALLLYGSLGRGRDFAWRGRRALGCLAIAAAFALTDEVHQRFVPERTGSLLDSAIDTAGAILAMAGVYAADRVLQARRRRSAAREAKPAET